MPIYVPGKVVLAKTFSWNETVWNPSMISTALWLDAADGSTITTSGSEVTQINDKSGNARNFTSASATRPSTGLATQGGKNVLSFNADFLTSDSANGTWTFLHDATGSSVFAAVRFGITLNPNAVYGLVGNNDADTRVSGYSVFYDNRTSASAVNRITSTITSSVSGQFVSNNVSSNDAVSSNVFGLVSCISDPSNATAANRSALRVNAGGEIKNNAATNAVSSSAPNNALEIGGNGRSLSAAGATLTGELAEIIILSGLASTDTRQRIEGYLAHKWGLTANLPSDHPYKTVGPTP